VVDGHELPESLGCLLTGVAMNRMTRKDLRIGYILDLTLGYGMIFLRTRIMIQSSNGRTERIKN
jgi:hypothetical protein